MSPAPRRPVPPRSWNGSSRTLPIIEVSGLVGVQLDIHDTKQVPLIIDPRERRGRERPGHQPRLTGLPAASRPVSVRSRVLLPQRAGPATIFRFRAEPVWGMMRSVTCSMSQPTPSRGTNGPRFGSGPGGPCPSRPKTRTRAPSGSSSTTGDAILRLGGVTDLVRWQAAPLNWSCFHRTP